MNEKVLPFFRTMHLAKKIIWVSLIVLSPILMILLILLFSTSYDVIGFFDWSLTFRIVAVCGLIFSIGVPGFLILDLIVAHRRLIIKRFPSRFMWALPTISVITSCLLFTGIALGPNVYLVDKDPELLLADGTGIYGIPDMAVAFWNVTPCINIFSWGTNPNYLNNTVSEKFATQEHIFMLTNLLPATIYHYTINNGALFNFTTAPGNDDNYTFAVGSDSHFGRFGNNVTAANALTPAWTRGWFSSNTQVG